MKFQAPAQVPPWRRVNRPKGGRCAHRLLLFLLLTSCATGSKQLVAIDSAVTDVQSGRAEQGRTALDRACEKGATVACALVGGKVSAIRPLSVMQSVTSNEQSRFVVVVPHREKLTYYMRQGDRVTKLNFERETHSGSSTVVDQVEAFGLEPRVGYELFIAGPDGMLWDKRGFKALALTRKRARLAVVSALDFSMRSESQKMWTQLLNQRPDVVVIVGDGIFFEKSFSGSVNADDLWKRYVETRESLQLFKNANLIPVLATWNDHDYGRNDGDRTFAGKTDAADIFLSFFAQRKPALGFERGPGVSSWWNAFGTHIAFLDNRSFRSPNGLDVEDQTHFGVEQEKWLAQHLSDAHEPVILASGDQFFGGYHQFESFEGSHLKRFSSILEEWKKDSEPLVFLSGGQKLTEVIKVPANKLGYPTFELTSSGMPTSYMMVELIRAERNFIQFDVQTFGPGQKQLYQKILTVKRQ